MTDKTLPKGIMTMKKMIALSVTALLLMTACFVMTLPVSAVDGVDEWFCIRSPWDYNGGIYTPAPGHRYTEEGFTCLPADYTGMTPYFTLQTKENHCIQDGVYMELRIDDFSYGGTNNADHWISFNLSPIENVTIGAADYADNVCTLIRGAGDGEAVVESYTTTQSNGTFAHQGNVDIAIPLDKEGREIYTFEIRYDEGQYEILICGTPIQGSMAISEQLNRIDPDGNFRVGVTFKSDVVDGTAACSILRYGTQEKDAVPPAGTDYDEPDANMLAFGEPIDPATVPTGRPALLWDATKTSFLYDPAGRNLKLTPNEENGYHMVAAAENPYFTWTVKNALTYQAEDFPVLAMLLKGYNNFEGSFSYCAGDVVYPSSDDSWPWYTDDPDCIQYDGEDGYTLVTVDLDGLWFGRIHAIRTIFQVDDLDDPTLCEWDVAYMGLFRTMEDAHAYADAYVAGEDPGAITTDDDSSEATAAPESDTAEATSDTTALTTAPVTDPVAETTGATPNDPAPAGGCSSVVGFGVLSLLAVAWIALRVRAPFPKIK